MRLTWPGMTDFAVPPAEYEQAYHRLTEAQAMAA